MADSSSPAISTNRGSLSLWRRFRGRRHTDAAQPRRTDSARRKGGSTQPLALIFDAYHATLGGNQRYICMLLGSVAPDNWRFALACPGEGRLTEAARSAGGEVHVVTQSRRLERGRSALLAGGLLDRFLTAAAIASFNLRFVALLRRLRPAVLQVHSTRNALMVGLAARIARVPMVLFIKGELGAPIFDRLAIALARRTLFISPHLIPAWRAAAHGTDAAGDVVPIGVDFDKVDMAETRATDRAPPDIVLEPGTVNFAFAGWLVPAKGVGILIDAFAVAIQHVPNSRLHILGAASDGRYMRELRERAALRAPAGSIRFLGWRDDVLDVLAAMDAFVLPSFSEGVPRSIVESMALGKAVIATRVGGIPELLDNGRRGVEVDAGDMDGLAEAIARVASDAALRDELGRRARTEARSRYTFESHVRALCVALDHAAGDRSDARHFP